MSGSQGAGTDDDVLIEILASRSGEQIKDIVKVYKKGGGGKGKARRFNHLDHFYYRFMFDNDVRLGVVTCSVILKHNT